MSQSLDEGSLTQAGKSLTIFSSFNSWESSLTWCLISRIWRGRGRERGTGGPEQLIDSKTDLITGSNLSLDAFMVTTTKIHEKKPHACCSMHQF